MTIETKTTLCPMLMQRFDRMLLSRPSVKFCDDCETLQKCYERILKRMNKANAGSRNIQKLKQEFEELYGRTKTKEDVKRTESQKQTPPPFYYINLPDKRDQKVWARLRLR